MGAAAGWSYGTDEEYRRIAEGLTSVARTDPGVLRVFVDALRNGADLMEAQLKAFPDTIGASEYRAIDENWFSDTPQWFGHSVLTPGQIHEVSREARARLAELLLAGASRVRIYISCGYPRFRMTLTWPGAHPDDAALTGDGLSWTPQDAAGHDVTLWVMAPFNTGYFTPAGYVGGARPAGQTVPGPLSGADQEVQVRSQEMLAELAARVQARMQAARAEATSAGLPPAQVEERVETARLAALAQVTPAELLFITAGVPRGRPVFKGDPILGARGDGQRRPGRQGLRITFDPAIHTPLPLPDGLSHAMPHMSRLPLAPADLPGISITWA